MQTRTPVIGGSPLALLPALERLDALLLAASDRAMAILAPDGASARGFAVGRDDVARLCTRKVGEPLFPPEAERASGQAAGPAWLAASFNLSVFDVDVLMLAIAPELDLRYERLYQYLQDDGRRRRPTVDLALNLLCANAVERIEARSRFAPDAPLVREHLLTVLGEPGESLLNRSLRPDEQVLRLLIGESTLDPRLAGCADLAAAREEVPDPPLAAATRQALPAIDVLCPRLQLLGAPDHGQADVAAMLAAQRGLPLLTVDLTRAALPAGEIARVAFREAWFRNAALLLTGLTALSAAESKLLAQELASSRVPVLLAGEHPWRPEPSAGGVAMVPFPSPDAAARRAVWRRELAEAGLSVAEPVISHLAGQYRLGPARIAEAVTEVALVVPDSVPDALAVAARRQSGHDLERLTRRVAPTFGWDDLVLPAATRRLLRELTDRVLHRQRVLVEWQFERVLALGRGTCALFAGPSGTGKSMAAGVIAAELGLDLYEINLATVVSKYIGETEQNLERIFTAAERTDAVLFFDEADALFGKRSDVTDAHDRYANLEIAYLLRRMEQYEGVAILATNLRENLDDAFLRRLHFVVDFPMPADDDRERMWRRFIPAGAPVADGIDYGFLAGRFGLSGGNIKNIVVSAAFLASANGGRIGMPHLIRATWGEHRKIGRVLSATDAGEYVSLVPTPDPDLMG
jgi:hypothetical protein